MYISQKENRKGPPRAHCFLPSPLYSILPGSPRLGRSPALRPGPTSPTHAAYHTPTLCQNGPAPHQPKRTSSVPAKTDQLCALHRRHCSALPSPIAAASTAPVICNHYGAGHLRFVAPRCRSSTVPAIPTPPPPFFRLAIPRCRSFHRAGSLQPLRHRPPPLCRPLLPQLDRAGHLAQGLVCTGWPCSPAKCCTNPNSISQKKCYHGQFTIS